MFGLLVTPQGIESLAASAQPNDASPTSTFLQLRIISRAVRGSKGQLSFMEVQLLRRR